MIRKLFILVVSLPFLLVVLVFSLFVSLLRGIGILGTKSWPDKIDRQKTEANSLVLKQNSYESAVSYSRFDEDAEKLLKFATKSIKLIDKFYIPPGFSYEFIATYPDVFLWWSSLTDEQQEKIFSGVGEDKMLDKAGKLEMNTLRLMIDAYKATGAKLECSID